MSLTFADRCAIAAGCLPKAGYREMLEKLHNEMLAAIASPVVAQSATTEVAALLAELDGARRDAERYRWIRGRTPGGAYRIAGVIYSEGGSGVDAAIDAAMKGKP